SSSTGSGPTPRGPGRRPPVGREWLVIARREFIERVRTKWFVVVTLLGPIGMIALIVVPAYLAMRSASEKAVIQVVEREASVRDKRHKLFPDIAAAAAAKRADFQLESVASTIDEKVHHDGLRDEKING